MITRTKNFGLEKHDHTGWGFGLNENFDRLDAILQDLADKIAALGPAAPPAAGIPQLRFGTAVTGESENAFTFSMSDIACAAVNDSYLNWENGCLYRCVTGGPPETAEWVFIAHMTGFGN